MTKTRTKRRVVAFRLTDQHEAIMAAVKIPHLNQSSLIQRAMDFGLEKAIREMTRAFVAEERN